MFHVKKALLVVTCLHLLSACQGSKNTTSNPGGAQAAQPQVMGTGDGGGGNAFDDKMLESYMIDPMTLAATTKYVLPILEKTQDPKDKKNNAKTFFNYKNWYLAPMSLKLIPKSNLGMTFVENNVQQVAIQSENSIWIDKKIFEKMSEVEQGKLILHEMLMTIYLARFNTITELCEKAKKIDPTTCDYNDDQKKYINQAYQPIPKRELNSMDYEAIRAATNWLFINSNKLDFESWSQYSKSISFSDPRFGHDPTNRSFEKDLKLRTKDFLNILETAKLTHNLPKECTSVQLGEKFPCELSWSINERVYSPEFPAKIKEIIFSVKNIKTQEIMNVSSIILYDEMNASFNISFKKEFWSISLMSSNLFSKDTKVGDVGSFLNIILSNNGKKITGLVLMPLVVTEHEIVKKVIDDNGVKMNETCTKQTLSRFNDEKSAEDDLVMVSSSEFRPVLDMMLMMRFSEMSPNCMREIITPGKSEK